jgi:hypothetical protein
MSNANHVDSSAVGPHRALDTVEPAAIIARMERDPQLPSGAGERFAGYGVMAAPFRSGHILAMRRYPASSLGQGYTSVWHRDPDGLWTFWSSRPPLEACPRYFGAAITRSVTARIDVRWVGPRALVIGVAEAGLHWQMDLETTAATRILNTLGKALPERAWRSTAILKAMGHIAGPLLHAGHLGLTGRAPNGQWFDANPLLLWTLDRSAAELEGRELGMPGPVPDQARLGDFWIPQRGLFAIGRAFFEPADPARHHLVAQAEPAEAFTNGAAARRAH